MAIEDKDNVDAHVRLYERQMAHYENTQSIEWKVTFGIWTLLAAAIYWAAQNAFRLGLDSRLRILLLAFPVLHAVWLCRIHESEEFDKRLWARYRTAARAILLSPTEVPKDERESTRNYLDEWTWILMEAGVTLMMALALRLML